MPKSIFLFLLFFYFSTSVLASSGLVRSDLIKAIYDLNSFIEDVSNNHIFTACYEDENELRGVVMGNISVLQEFQELILRYDSVEANVRKSMRLTPESVIVSRINIELDKLDIEKDDLIVKSTETNIQIQKTTKKYGLCQQQEQETYNNILEQYNNLVSTKDYKQVLIILGRAKINVYPESKHYKMLLEKIDSIKKLQSTEQSKQVIVELKKTSSKKNVIVLSDANELANASIINKQATDEAHNLQSLVLRQEVIGMAMKLSGITLPTEHICRNIFKDVANAKPNNWICRAVEIAVENGIVSSANKNFNPESNITRAEALALLMKAAGIKIQEG